MIKYKDKPNKREIYLQLPDWQQLLQHEFAHQDLQLQVKTKSFVVQLLKYYVVRTKERDYMSTQ